MIWKHDWLSVRAEKEFKKSLTKKERVSFWLDRISLALQNRSILSDISNCHLFSKNCIIVA